ncbi:MAG: hypothetical protein IT269_10205, partial [Saprospiraceae bacterium]|nr:hypothetical protein [Saprospiraceae bacterium]
MQDLNSALNRVEQLARTSKLGRLVANPFRYLRAIGHHRLAYPITRRGLLIETP